MKLWILTLASYLELDNVEVSGNSHKAQLKLHKIRTEHEATHHTLENEIRALRIR